MSDRHSVIPRTMCFVFCGDHVLLMKASEKKAYPGMYDPLGGHIEKGEDIITCAVREIKEESGLDVLGTRLRGIIHVSNFFGKNVMLFVTSSQVSERITPPVHDEGIPEWVSLDKLGIIKIFDDVRPILQTVARLKEGELFTGISSFDDKGKLLKLDFRIS